MADRRKLVAGNWKMNGLRSDGLGLTRDLVALATQPHPCDLLVCPPATLLTLVADVLRGSGIALGGLTSRSQPHPCDLLVCPPATLLTLVADVLRGSGIALGGQDCHPAPSGAYTG